MSLMYSTIFCHAGKGRRKITPTTHMTTTETQGTCPLLSFVSTRGPAFISPLAKRIREPPVT